MDLLRKKPRWKRWLVGALGALLLVALVARRGPTLSASGLLVDRQSAWTDRVRRGDLVVDVPVQGTLVPERVRWLSAETPARVARIAVRPGAEVEADTVVVVLENADLELAALEAGRSAASAAARLAELDVRTGADAAQQAATLATLRAELKDSDRHAETANRLARDGLLAENARQDALARRLGLTDRLEHEAARATLLTNGRTAQLRAQQLEIEQLQKIAVRRGRQVADLEIRAGVRGIVQELPLVHGQWVGAGALLAKIAEPGALKADLAVAQSWARDVARGQTVRFPALGAEGRIVRVDPGVMNGSVKIEARVLDGLPATARPDQTVTGSIEIARLENVLHVARPAGARDQALARVYRVDPKGAAPTDVRLGRGSARAVAIEDGLAEGDEIVVSDVSSWDATTGVRWQ